MSQISRGVLVCAFAFIGLQTWAALSPSHHNWGFHYFAFFPPVVGAAALASALALFVPRMRTGILSALSSAAESLGKLPSTFLLLLLLGVAVVLMVLVPVRTNLLGDSELILELTPKLPSVEDATANFRNQPLTYAMLRLIQWVAGGGSVVETASLYRIAGGIAGLIYLAMIFGFIRALEIPKLDAALLGIILLFRVGTQFFLGYVENYMFFYVCLTGYVLTGWLAITKKLPLWIPLALLAILPGFHLAGFVFYPTAVVLLYPWFKAHRRSLPFAAAGFLVAAAGAALLLGPSWLLTRLDNALTHDLLPLATPDGGIPYGIFSAAHLVDWVNAYLHIAPLSLACVALGLIFLPREEYAGPLLTFLAVTSAVGLGFTFVVLPALGMARDWDMLSNFFSPLRVLTVFFILAFLRRRELRHAVLVVAAIGVIRLAGWIGINADTDRHLARAEVLTAPELSGTFPKIYYENLAKTFFDRKQFASAARWYEQYLREDSLNARILANLSDCYRALGDEKNLFRMLTLSASAGSKHPGVYSNIALEYTARGDTDRAIFYLYEALRHDPAHPISHANLGILMIERRDYKQSLWHSTQAIRHGMRDPVVYRNAGYASYFLSDYRNAVVYLKEYLKAAPSDKNARILFEELQRRMGSSPRELE